MSTPPASAFGPRPVLSAARAADAALAGGAAQVGQLWALSDAEVAESLGHLERVRAAAEAQQVAVVTEARSRGLGNEQGWSGVDWSTAAAPGMSTGHASTLQVVADACRDPRLDDLATAVESGAISLTKAAQLARFHRSAAPVADPAQLADDTATLVQAAPDLTEQQLALAIRHAAALLRPEKDAEHLTERQRAARALHKGSGPGGMSTYRVVLDPEGAAILDAALDPLARPRPAKDDPDLRTPAARRADALLAIIGRGVSAPGAAPKTAKAQLVVTMTLEQLTGAVRGAGLTLGQELLTAGTVRRLACEADLIPAVLGTNSELLDVGRRKRLVPPAIRLAAWLRDRGCTWPGCTVPAQWCDAHHAIPWWHGGDTSLANTALLCGRHHTLVHDRALTCTITDTHVTWHL
ncbi:HNH endonuclease signature motif containing protein [Phycicoccus sp. SLBN-51]|uniref:HNH endonuclease signature motif containing protein n=1 Tax=Phycicoccus sp. SLBN-51 TaxID=2768447 RepID=UPI001168A06B|nr:HNH endonuclease signature motif containing protein [Phycicoccus sp. SLBN-51]TQJ51029.1 uncharacterized protein DUF222 [Phycicoccus sp. SLBN-51]